MTDIDDFLDSLASGGPVPGGGAVAGFQVAMGASLIVMVCELTLGREKFASVASDVQRVRDRADQLRHEARALVDADGEAFGEVARAMKLPRVTDEEKAVRRAAVQEALKGAVQPPLDTMQAAHEALTLASELAPIGNPSAISDVGSAALALEAGYHAAKLNVEINLAAIKDQEFNERIRHELPDDSVLEAARGRTVDLVVKSIRGER